MAFRGKKTKRNQRINKSLKASALALGLPLICELQIDSNCTQTMFLSWAHSRRRNNWQTAEHETEACLACINCHTAADRKGHEENERLIKEAISRR